MSEIEFRKAEADAMSTVNRSLLPDVCSVTQICDFLKGGA